MVLYCHLSGLLVDLRYMSGVLGQLTLFLHPQLRDLLLAHDLSGFLLLDELFGAAEGHSAP